MLVVVVLALTTGLSLAPAARGGRAQKTLPQFHLLKLYYPGYRHHGGKYNNHHLIRMIGCNLECRKKLLHDTSALRLSYALNKIGSYHSLGIRLIQLSKFGQDSVSGNNRLQYIYHPIAYGPYLADKYGYPTVSKIQVTDPINTKKKFWQKQGILRVITYTKVNNRPKGHVALWDCDHFHQSKDWIYGHSLITVEFWESPDSNCTSSELPTSTIHSSNFKLAIPEYKRIRHHFGRNGLSGRRYKHN